MRRDIATYSLLGRPSGSDSFNVVILRTPSSAIGGERGLVAQLFLTADTAKAAYFESLEPFHPVPFDIDALPNVDGLLEMIGRDWEAAAADMRRRARDWVQAKVAPFYHGPLITDKTTGTLALRSLRLGQKMLSAAEIADVEAATPGRDPAQARRRARASSAVWI
jgi:hypothetical protein